MRPHAIILLLGSLAVAVDAFTCNTNVDNTNKNSHFIKSEIIIGSPDIARMMCADSGEVFEHGQRQYEVLECTDDEWTYGGKSLVPPVLGDKMLDLKCVTKRPVSDSPLATTLNPDPITATEQAPMPECVKNELGIGLDMNLITELKMTIVCGEANEEIEYAGQRFDRLDCADAVWTHNNKPLIPTPPLNGVMDRKVEYRCVPKRPAVPDTTTTLKPAPTTTTTKQALPLVTTTTLASTPTTVVEDVSRKCETSLIRGPASGEFTFDTKSKKLTCNDGKTIEYNERRFEKLECKNDGWEGMEKGGFFPVFDKLNVKADEELEIRCVAVKPSPTRRPVAAPTTTTKQSPVTVKRTTPAPPKPTTRDTITTTLEKNRTVILVIVLVIAVLFAYMSEWTGDKAESKKNHGMSYPSTSEV